MMRLARRRFLVVAVCILLLMQPRRARADSLHTAAVEVIVAIIAVTAAVTVGIVIAVKHQPSLKGCAATGPDGLSLTQEDGRRYLLVGDTATFQPGDRVRVSGKKSKSSGVVQRFVVEKAKDYGPCPAAAQP